MTDRHTPDDPLLSVPNPVTDQVQRDRLDDEDELVERIRGDRQTDRHYTTDRVDLDNRAESSSQRQGIREDRRADTAASSERLRQERMADALPLAQLEVRRAERLERAITLLEATRRAGLAGVILMALVLCGLVYVIDYMGDNRKIISDSDTHIQEVERAAEQVEREFEQFRADNQAYIDNHQKTQRIICYALRSNELPLPENGDCDGR